jgi:hypothetical protein
VRRLAGVFVAVAAALSPLTLYGQSPLDSAKDLYASASYEAALTALTALDTNAAKDDRVQIDTYRALCFLALGRSREAESTLEQIVVLKPTYLLDETEHSPRIITMFRDVRRRALPAAAQQLYLSAKGEYDGKNYALAATQFKQLLALLDAPDAGDQAGKLADLKELASGFLTLAEGRLAPAAAPAPAARSADAPAPPVSKPVAPPPSPAAPASAAAGRQQNAPLSWPVAAVQAGSSRPSMTAAAAAASAAIPIYSLSDTDVTPPVPIEQRIPPWNVPAYLRERTSLGRLEVLIDETGAVRQAALQRPIWPAFDAALIEAAKRWRYQPARRQGQPVRYRRLIEISGAEPSR